LEPGGRRPAPGRLRLVQAFINTLDVGDGRDAFVTPAALERWLTRRQLLGRADTPPDESDRRRALAVREALRTLLAGREGAVDPDARHNALRTLDRASRRARLTVRFDGDRSALHPTRGGVDGALGRILAEAALSMAEGSWTRLKVCRNGGCRWAFYDASRNRSGHWCSMAVCGNRMKSRTYRARHRAVP
jgi:predicted RNA-binding Zn ribbon-like protein